MPYCTNLKNLIITLKRIKLEFDPPLLLFRDKINDLI